MEVCSQETREGSRTSWSASLQGENAIVAGAVLIVGGAVDIRTEARLMSSKQSLCITVDWLASRPIWVTGTPR